MSQSQPLPALAPATHHSVLLLSFATFSSMVAQRICDAMLPELARVFSVGLAQAAQVVSMFAVTYGLAQLIYGPLGDRIGKFRVITTCTLACSLGNLLAVFAASLNWLVLARMLVALCAASMIPLAMAWVGDHVGYAQRQVTLARVGLGTSLGLVTGQLAGGLFADTLGWRWAFGFMTLLFGVVGLLLLGDLRRQQRAAPVALSGPAAGFATQARGIFMDAWCRVVLLVAFLEGSAALGVLAIWASHLHQTLGLSLTASGAIVALFGLGGLLYMASARVLIHRLGERRLAVNGAAMMGLAYVVMGLSTHWPLDVLASVIAGFGFSMVHNTVQANATQMAPTARGTATSRFALLLFMGQSVGVLLAAALVGWLGSGWTIALGGCIMTLTGLGFAAALQRRSAQLLAA